jgi:hypothetical protein
MSQFAARTVAPELSYVPAPYGFQASKALAPTYSGVKTSVFQIPQSGTVTNAPGAAFYGGAPTVIPHSTPGMYMAPTITASNAAGFAGNVVTPTTEPGATVTALPVPPNENDIFAYNRLPDVPPRQEKWGTGA